MTSPERVLGDEPGREQELAPLLEWIVYGMPLTVTGRFAVGAISYGTAQSTGLHLSALFPDARGPMTRTIVNEPRARGIVFRGEQLGILGRADLVIDSGGVVAARWARRRERGVVHLETTGHDLLVPLVKIVAATMRDLDGLGRAACRLELRRVNGLTIQAGDGQVAVVPDGHHTFIASGDLPIPAEADDVTDLVGRWLRELARWLGLPQWENAPTEG